MENYPKRPTLDRNTAEKVLKSAIIYRTSLYEDSTNPLNGKEVTKFYENSLNDYLESCTEEVTSLVENYLEASIDASGGVRRDEALSRLVEDFVDYLRSELEISWLTRDGYAIYLSWNW